MAQTNQIKVWNKFAYIALAWRKFVEFYSCSKTESNLVDNQGVSQPLLDMLGVANKNHSQNAHSFNLKSTTASGQSELSRNSQILSCINVLQTG